MYTKIDKCRVSMSTNLITVLSLGHQALTGVFPKSKAEQITTGPLELVWCPDSGLLQLKHSYDPSEMYGENYGYRSGLNASMVEHLQNKVSFLEALVDLKDGDTVLDIGSNDCTTLKSYTNSNLNRIGIDPTGEKFRQHYPKDYKLVSDFFTADSFFSVSTNSANIVTSIAMFYDLDDPYQFATDIESVLDRNGIWHFEQSYMPSMLRLNSYDTICHEHLEYYSLSVVTNILDKAGLKIIDVKMNSINGGSFAVTACKSSCDLYKPNHAVIDWMLGQEDRMGLNTPRPYRLFEERVFNHKDDLLRLIRSLVADGKKVLGYGASTKGNVVLQFCGLTSQEIPAIAEVNPEKFGRYTPGTHIPIISEADAKAMNPDYFLVLPWHFKDSILRREKKFLNSGGKFIFPFPEIEIL
ncbi:S-adenosyl-L-methionine-dependent methyltransferase [Synechococcus sp. A18-40]|nr:S-adenosyl-L-methionine-dependent methyltransferase [Synechococcus sp. A18-40]